MKILLIFGLAFALAGLAFADIIGTIDTTDGHHYELGKIGSIWELREADGFYASGIWAGDIELYMEGPGGCKAIGTRAGDIISWRITDPYRQ